MRVKLTLDYVGTAYAGWQVQPGQDTVQGRVEQALLEMTGAKIPVTASGRTDAGVHALGQVAHFDTDRPWAPSAFVGGLNRFLPRDVRILKAEEAPDGFHARYSAIEKTYVYRIYISPVDRAAYYGRAMRADALDVPAMHAAAARFIGTHDFTSFCAANADTTTVVRTVSAARVEEREDQATFTVTADGFLYNMVRIMTGALLRVGRGKLDPDGLTAILKARNRRLAPDTAPACGLYLKEVVY